MAEIELEFHPGEHQVPTLGAELACTCIEIAGPLGVTQAMMDPRGGGVGQGRVGVLTGCAICEISGLYDPVCVGVVGMIERH